MVNIIVNRYAAIRRIKCLNNLAKQRELKAYPKTIKMEVMRIIGVIIRYSNHSDRPLRVALNPHILGMQYFYTHIFFAIPHKLFLLKLLNQDAEIS
jgi:hypothetical protein